MRKALLFALVVILGHCTGRREAIREPPAKPPSLRISDPAQAEPIAGHWVLRRADAASQGMQLELLFDSLAGSSFRARIVFLMQGNLGLDVSWFEPAIGAIRPDSTVRLVFSVPRRELENRLAGKVRGDTIALTEFLWAGEDWLRGGARWVLVREGR